MVPGLPKTKNGKIMRRAIRARYLGEPARRHVGARRRDAARPHPGPRLTGKRSYRTCLWTQSELDLIRDSIRKIAEEFDLDYWRQKDKNKEYPWDFKDALAAGGWLGMLMPEEYGGMGLGLTEVGVVLDELGQRCGFNANSVFQYYVFPPGPVIHHGSEEMKKEFLPKLASGEEMMCFGVSEPDNGVDTSRLKTFAKKEGNRYLVNGRKVWISNALNADRILLLTRTSPRNPERPFDGMTLFLTQLKGKKGVAINRIDKIMRNAVDSNEIVFEDFEVFENEIVGEEGKGFRCLLDGLNPERIAVAQTCHRPRPRGAEPGGAIRQGPHRLRPADRQEPGGRAPARRQLDPARGGGSDDAEGSKAVRRGQALRTGSERREVPRAARPASRRRTGRCSSTAASAWRPSTTSRGSGWKRGI